MVVLLTRRAECSLFTSKPAHSSPYLPTKDITNSKVTLEMHGLKVAILTEKYGVL
jgi:hypothetical protein